MQLAVQLLSARSDRRCGDTRTIISLDREVSDAERVCIRAMRIVVYCNLLFISMKFSTVVKYIRSQRSVETVS